ncbi:hypothetical protein BRADI_3g18622v3 [Brachypodium distachyon]|uniref:Uncharacterized protein n=1 Tax=Brachypodium distachyon TaxID=15368 RepID=A0A2K2CY36_BRADI|nr:hypothetical protein BRADI_3g18622v3 [Brachypodium distachyon]
MSLVGGDMKIRVAASQQNDIMPARNIVMAHVGLATMLLVLYGLHYRSSGPALQPAQRPASHSQYDSLGTSHTRHTPLPLPLPGSSAAALADENARPPAEREREREREGLLENEGPTSEGETERRRPPPANAVRSTPAFFQRSNLQELPPVQGNSLVVVGSSSGRRLLAIGASRHR